MKLKAKRCFECGRKPNKKNPILSEAPDLKNKWQILCLNCVASRVRFKAV